MKFVLAFIFALAGIAQAQHHNHGAGAGDRKAVHGMLVFGTSQLYVSHLPLFGSPHDYQVIMEVDFDDESKAKYTESLKTLASDGETYHSIEPEAFVLPEMISDMDSFSATLYRGHFERGGKELVSNVTVTKKRVIQFHKFGKDDKRDEKARWSLVGNVNEQFLVHKISARPDFDQIMQVSVVGSVAKELDIEGGMLLTSKMENSPVDISKLEEGTLTLFDGKKKIDVSKMSPIYLEEKELE
jgi:hypothetical protein